MYTTERIIRGQDTIETLREIVGDIECYIAGGFMRWACSSHSEPAPYGDIDIFPNGHYDELFSILNRRMVPYRSSRFSNTYVHNGEQKFQLIKPADHIVTSGDLPTILNSFDFTVVMIGMPLGKDEPMAHINFAEHEHSMTLAFYAERVSNPLATLLRAFKYASKGYTMEPFAMVTLMERMASVPDTILQKFRTDYLSMYEFQDSYYYEYDYEDEYDAYDDYDDYDEDDY